MKGDELDARLRRLARIPVPSTSEEAGAIVDECDVLVGELYARLAAEPPESIYPWWVRRWRNPFRRATQR